VAALARHRDEPPPIGWADAWTPFTLALRAQGARRNSLRGYEQTSTPFLDWAARDAPSTTPSHIDRDTIHRFLESLAPAGGGDRRYALPRREVGSCEAPWRLIRHSSHPLARAGHDGCRSREPQRSRSTMLP